MPRAPRRASLVPDVDATVGDVGEVALLEKLRPFLAGPKTPPSLRSKLLIGPGDDGAVWQPTDGWSVVITTDSLVEEVHFHTPVEDSAGVDIGWKLLAVSYSDLAAMGARPGPSFVSLSLPASWPASLVEALYRGLHECVASLGGALAGGNISASDTAVLTSTCVGEADPAYLMRRAGAEPGWLLAVTGEVGGAAAALRLAHGDPDASAAGGADAAASAERSRQLSAWQRRLRRPMPRVHVATLAARAGATVAIDVSDGLYLDASRLLAAATGSSATGVVIDAAAIPVAPGVREQWPEEWLDVAGGGEDYELLLAAPEDVMGAVAEALATTHAPARVIGRFDGGDGVRVESGGAVTAAPGAGHEHFAG